MSSKQMAHQSKKREKMESSASSSPLHFFKIIQAHAIKHKRLGIPEEFLKKFGNELSDSAIIKVPSGSIWRIGLTNTGGVTSFEHGLQEFMEFYSISAGHLLVFRYDGNSTFHVLIFTMSATEIEYPMRSFKTMFKGKAQVIDIDSCSSDSNNENSTQSEPSSSRDSQVNLETEPVDEHDYPKRRKVSAATKRFNTSRVTQLKERALRAAEAFRSEEPFFKAIMHASCVKSGGNMHVPSDFAIPYLQHKTTRVTLRVSDGKSWDVGVLYTQNFYKTTLSKGWRKFALDNHLNTGDVCVFELVDRKKFEINVHIFQVFKTNFRDEAQVIRLDSCSTRSNNETSTQSSSTRGGQVNLETEEPVMLHNQKKEHLQQLRHLHQIIHSSRPLCAPSSNGVVNIPGNFATPYLKHKTALVTLSVSDGKLWDVILTSINSGTTTLSNGWKQFVSDNQLNQGDVCVFELVDRKYFVMNVHIFRVFQKTCSSSEELEIDAPRAGRSKEKSLAAANAFKSKKPYFKMVPAAFSVPYLKHETKVRLRGVDGKTWEMQCNLLHKPDRAKLFKG